MFMVTTACEMLQSLQRVQRVKWKGKQKANEVRLNRSSLQSQPHTNTVNQITTPLTLVVLANVPVLTLLLSFVGGPVVPSCKQMD